MRAILSVRPKCSHSCASLKESPWKPVQILQHATRTSTEQTSMRTKWFTHDRDLNCSGASPSSTRQKGGNQRAWRGQFCCKIDSKTWKFLGWSLSSRWGWLVRVVLLFHHLQRTETTQKWPKACFLGARLRGRTATQRSKQGSEKVLGS